MTTPAKRGRGRPAGARNKRTEERQQRLADLSDKLSETLPDCFEGDAHALLMAVYKDKSLDLETRIDAAKAAIRYETPALSTIDAKLKADVSDNVVTVIKLIAGGGSED